MRLLHFQSIKGKAEEILKAILQTAEVSSCHIKDVLLLRLACEEIVMNVTSYAYAPETEGWTCILRKPTASLSVSKTAVSLSTPWSIKSPTQDCRGKNVV